MMLLPIVALLSYGLVVLAVPLQEKKDLESRKQEVRPPNLPVLKLGYGDYQATSYDSQHDLYIWRNIRFAAPPTGKLRFAKPALPTNFTVLQDNRRQGWACPQLLTAKLASKFMGSILGGSIPSFLDGILNGGLFDTAMGALPTSEDCLFLDIVVPGKAWRGETKLPVVNWMYGGAYILGSKDLDGAGIVRASEGHIIYVAGNYRLGALGFLAGVSVEKDKMAVANAALYDQRAVLEWIQKNADKFGGDPNDVSVWGESAGAGSILHHLIAFGGKQDPLFKKAVIESAAYSPFYDRKGGLERTFQEFAALAGCAGKGLDCLRAADFPTIHKAQRQYIDSIPDHLTSFGFGPSVDGEWVRQLPALEMATGHVVKGVDSLIVSHVANEAKMFVFGKQNETTYRAYADFAYGNKSILTDAVDKHYPHPGKGLRFETHNDRMTAQIQFSAFTCNTRWMSEAYKNKTWNVQYSYTTGMHGTDVAATFYDPTSSIQSLANMVPGGIALTEILRNYQSYLLSYARTGDPNRLKLPGAIEWPKVTLGSTLTNVLNVAQPFSLVADHLNMAKDCDFWLDIFAGSTILDGYAPPGAVVPSKIINSTGNPSANFITL